MVISLRSSFQRAAKKLSGDAPRRCQARSHTYSVGRWSKLAAAAAGKLTSCLSGGRPGADVARPVRHPRMETAVAAAARAAGAKNTVAKARPARPSPCSLARLGHLPSAEADGASGPVALHGALVAQGALRPDAAQDVIVGLLEEVRGEVMRRRENASGQTRRSLGLYLHGPVGCGKTLAMDLLVASLRGAPTLRLRRVHFHDFLGEVHSELHASRGTHAEPLPQPTTKKTESRGNSERWWLLGADDDSGRRRTGRAATCVLAERKGGEASSVERVAAKLARGLDVLCFDEVAITTIQDCVIVAPLFRMFYEMGVTVVATSNRAPEALYAGGLNRHIHLPPFVQMLRESCRVHEVLSNADYRAEVAATGQDAGVLLWGCEPSDVDDRARSFLNTWWRRLSPNADRTSKLHATSDNKGFDGVYETVKVAYGRLLQVHVSANLKLVRFTFKQLCEAPLAAEDYSALCGAFPCVFVDGVPRLRGASGATASRRWTLFLDCCYEHGTLLVATFAAHGPEDVTDLSAVAEVGAGGGRSLQETAFAVARATSRLKEMGTKSYFDTCLRVRDGMAAQLHVASARTPQAKTE